MPPRITPLLPALLAGCTILGIEGNGGEEAELTQARARWGVNRPNEYSYTLERLCFCGLEAMGPVQVVVRGDSVVSRTYASTGAPVPAAFASLFGPVDSVFAQIEVALERGADSLEARYHARYGYPLEVVIDFARNAVDDELELHVREFAVRDLLRPGPAARSGALTAAGLRRDP